MQKKIIIIVICAILVILLSVVVIFNKDKKLENTENSNNYSVIYDKGGIIRDDMSKQNEITEVIEDTVVQGMVELNYNGYIYIFNGQHFGEYGFQMDEYTRANIENKNQECIDYYTSEKYDTSYIQEGDIIICKGDLKKYSIRENELDTKDNAIIVLKSDDYNKMKKDVLNGDSKYSSELIIGDIYPESGYIYLKYSLYDNTNSDTEYNFPFAVKAYITENTQIIGNLQNGKIVKVQYENSNVSLDELKLKSIEIIED